MSRDLTDLMERAVSTAPPEPHHAADITHLARRRQRRRTTFLAAGAALAVVAVAGATVGLTENHPSRPEPAGPSYLYGQHQKLSDALRAGSAHDVRTLDYHVPSVADHLGHGLAPVGQYLDIDARGRLAMMRVKVHGPPSQIGLSATYELVDGPGGPVRDVPAPPFPGSQNPSGILHLSFTADDRLLWSAPGIDFRVTALDGGSAVTTDRTTSDVPGDTTYGVHSVRNVWMDGGRVWFSAVTKNHVSPTKQSEWVSLMSFDPSHPQRLRLEAARDVLEIDMAGGEAVWIDASGTKVLAEDLSTGRVHAVPIPLDRGCRIPPADDFSGGASPQTIVTNGSLVALEELCGQRSAGTRVVVTDLAGQLVTDVDPGPSGRIFGLRLKARLMTFAATGNGSGSFVDDLTTGRLTELGSGTYPVLPLPPTSTGRYVLWYDKTGGHVGEFTW